jgi:DNA-binding MarR family transcriptional regulator
MHSNCKLTKNDVLQIRQLCDVNRNSQRALAKEFKVSQSTISRIFRGIIYKKFLNEKT